MNHLNNISFFFKKNIYLVILLLLIIPTYLSLIRPGFFPMQDDLQAFRIHQMDQCLKDWQFPCRWVPDGGYQYGYPLFIYYSPSVYYLGEIIHLLGFQFIDAVKILFILGFITSAVFMFTFLKNLFNPLSALVGGVLYSYIPYKAVDVYVRGAMSEFWALSIFPLVFWSSLMIVRKKEIKYVAWFSLSLGLLLTTHNLMSLIFLPIISVWILSLFFLEKKWDRFLPLLFGGILGFGLAAFFTLPLLTERKFVHIESLLGGYFDYRAHFVNLEQLFLSNYFGYGSSFLGPGDDLSLTAGPIHILVSLIAIFFAIINFKKEKKVAKIILILFFSNLAVLFLIHQRSSFIWNKISILSWLQFPWRFLGISIFLSSITAASLIYFISSYKIRFVLVFVVIASVLVLHINFFKPLAWLNISDQEKFQGKSWEKQLTISIFDYLPIYAKFPPTKKAPEFPEVLVGKAEFEYYKKRTNIQEGKVKVEQPSLFRLPMFDFPGMRVTVDGEIVNYVNDNCTNQEFCLGLITFNISKGEHIIKAELRNTTFRNLGDFISLISIIILVSIFVLKDKALFIYQSLAKKYLQ